MPESIDNSSTVIYAESSASSGQSHTGEYFGRGGHWDMSPLGTEGALLPWSASWVEKLPFGYCALKKEKKSSKVSRPVGNNVRPLGVVPLDGFLDTLLVAHL